jgi:hypothetical protein
VIDNNLVTIGETGEDLVELTALNQVIGTVLDETQAA